MDEEPSSNLTKTQISLRLTAEAQELLRQLAEKRGISKTAMMEILLRERADEEGVYA
jgi:hypothetical protein